MAKKFEIFIKNTATVNDKVAAIKAIRWITGFGLKEAKDLIDAVCNGITHTFKEQNACYRNTEYSYSLDEELKAIRACGFTVVEMSDILTTQVQAIAVEAINACDYDLAIDLIRILKTRQGK
jgi:hypothetical protein